MTMQSATREPIFKEPGGIREPQRAALTNKADVSFNTVEQIDQDSDLWFQIRGYGYNPLVDASLPIIGLVMRIRKLNKNPNVDELYTTVRNQIATIGEEIAQHKYDNATQLAYRYCLCSFVDEAVMGTPWGAQSIWAERSLLSIYHDETWGGEKFFTIMSRMLMDQEKYRDVLEFMYVCLCMGFKGRYGVQINSGDELQAIITKLHKALRQMRGETPETLTAAHSNVASRNFRVGKQWAWWAPWAAAAVVLVLAFVIYSLVLNATTNEVIRSLDTVLQQR